MKISYVVLVGVLGLALSGVYLKLSGEFSQEGVESPQAIVPQAAALAQAGVESPALSNAAESRQAENTELRHEMTQLRQEFVALRTEMLAQKEGGAGALAHKPAQAEPSREEIRVKEEGRLQKQIEAIDASYRQQTTDARWAAKTKKVIQEALVNDQVPAKAIVNIECRVSMCRVELSIGAQEQPVQFTGLAMQTSLELPNMRVNQIKERDGSTTSVLYLSKEDFGL
jgi:hypothetical protein